MQPVCAARCSKYGEGMYLQGDEKPLELMFGITIIGKGGEDEKVWRTAQRLEGALLKAS
jgi:Asp-tRNA(Asn)/Glu-tRNA(Gln) amidotransferase A subunit family amidase